MYNSFDKLQNEFVKNSENFTNNRINSPQAVKIAAIKSSSPHNF